ncbi:MAG TPA: Flp pilus assembly protein CpaB [Aliiroseovarius sp.]|nr:Flp pilus assembly protein CpaB [Aliiroseovarius sp.]
MRLVFGLVLILGLGLAGFAVYMAREYIGNQQAQLAAERAARAQIVPTVEVFVVNERLGYGQQITEENIRAVKWPENAIPEGTFQSLAELFPDGERRFRTVLRAMEKDEAVLAVKVTEPGTDAGVSSRLGKGMRAFALRVDVASGVSGFLRPGDRVDIYWTGRASMDGTGGQNQEITRLIQPGINIIAVDQTADSDRSSPTIARTVTVEATPQQVAALAQAQSTGALSLSLVGSEDETIAEAVDIDQNRLLGIAIRAREEPPEERRVCTIRTRRGSETIEVPVACPSE